MNTTLEPRKRTAVDGKDWWCVYNPVTNSFSTLIGFGKYKTKKACQLAIDYYYGKNN